MICLLRYDINDPEFEHMVYVMRDFEREAGPRFLLWEFSPLIPLIDRKMVKKHRDLLNGMIDTLTKKFVSHTKDYEPGIERDFCDALIAAKNDALIRGKESAPFLTDTNLAITVFDLFFAGTDTSQQTFQWFLLFMAH